MTTTTIRKKLSLVERIYYAVTFPIRLIIVIVWVLLTVTEDDFPEES